MKWSSGIAWWVPHCGCLWNTLKKKPQSLYFFKCEKYFISTSIFKNMFYLAAMLGKCLVLNIYRLRNLKWLVFCFSDWCYVI